MSTPISIIPVPVACRPTGGTPFALTSRTVVIAPQDAALRFTADEAARLLAVPQAASAPAGGNAVTLAIDPALTVSLGAEGYRLAVSANEVAIRGGGAAGVFYGLQTLRQLLPPDIERFGKKPMAGA